jgi:two-component system sensor histidine kinase BaeS
MTAAASSWVDAVRANPLASAIASVALVAGAVGAGLLLRRLTSRTRSLRHLVLAVTLAALALAAAAAVALARLMVLDGREARLVIGVLAVTAVLATLLVLVASAPLGRDARRLEVTVRRIEAGDRSVRSGIVRADELGHVAAALDELTARLDALEREREGVEQERAVMLSSVGHDLRTPLAALRAAIEALSDGVADDPQRFLGSMLRDVEALGALVDDVFLLARIEAGRVVVTREPVDLTEVADEAIEALTPVADERGLRLELRATARVRVAGNAAALGRVVRNLIDNAIRHAPAGTTVVVDVSATGEPSVRVIDEGPGFPAGFDEHAFDRFTRPDASRQRTTGGAGLGLAIARGLVEAHGGRIWIEAPPGGRVAFQLPAA